MKDRGWPEGGELNAEQVPQGYHLLTLPDEDGGYKLWALLRFDDEAGVWRVKSWHNGETSVPAGRLVYGVNDWLMSMGFKLSGQAIGLLAGAY
ncbi:hypothetical protein [Nocardia sp. NPDC004860]|uniref:hypothetical protein n=1 Tax=Nocardia sp. NPDC004860 TaxID=3154557 RepID=UPI0033B194B6